MMNRRVALFHLILLAATVAAFAMAVLTGRAWSADGHTHHGAVGKFYETWMRPDSPNVSCCNREDCAPAHSRFHEGHWQARYTEHEPWTIVPPQKIEHDRDSPDGRSHLCAARNEMTGELIVICFKPGAGS